MGVDITEVYSPPRMEEACSNIGPIGGSSLDRRTGWVFRKPAHRAAATWLIKEEAPRLLIGSPPCTKFSNLQNLNMSHRGKEWAAKFYQKREEAVQHF